MPCASSTIPPYGISLLKSCLVKNGIACDIFYANLLFANKLGDDLNDSILSTDNSILGELLFSELYNDIEKPENVECYKNVSKKDIIKYRKSAKYFFEKCKSSINFNDYSVIGFTVSIGQIFASLLLAREIRATNKDVKIVFGGGMFQSNVISGAYLENYEFLDAIFWGKSENSFVNYCRFINNEILNMDQNIALVYNNGDRHRYVIIDPLVIDFDYLPLADFSDWINQFKISHKKIVILPYESSRGCFWGRCKFCTETFSKASKYKTKSAKLFYDEITSLIQKYNPDRISFVDDVLSKKYFKTAIPQLINDNLKVQFYFMLRIGIKKEELAILKRLSNKLEIWFGIETMNRETLELMDKGTSVLMNIQALKNCNELSIKVFWKMLYGSLDESIKSYEDMAKLIDSIVHLTPPITENPINVLKYSPMYNDYIEEKGVALSLPIYKYLYGENYDENLAWEFYFPDHIKKNQNIYYLCKKYVRIWRRKYFFSYLFFIKVHSLMLIFDSRKRFPKIYFLNKSKRYIINCCESIISYETLQDSYNIVNKNANDFIEDLNFLIKRNLIITDSGYLLSVVINLKKKIINILKLK